MVVPIVAVAMVLGVGRHNGADQHSQGKQRE
jgi:hypothetical protein